MFSNCTTTNSCVALTLLGLSLRVTHSRAGAIFDDPELGRCARMRAGPAEWCHRKLRFGYGADPIHLSIRQAKTDSSLADGDRAPWHHGGRDILHAGALQLSIARRRARNCRHAAG